MIKLTHGGDIYSAKERIDGPIVDFSANINPMGLPASVRQALCDAMDTFSCYPDPLCRELTAEIAKSEQVAPASVLCANGAADLIFRVAWAMRPRSALIIQPTFSEYEQALTACGCRVEHYQLSGENDFRLTGQVLDHIHSQTDIVFLCNPNNPTGQLTDQSLLERILVRCAACGTLLVVDECFRDFLDQPQENTMTSWVASFPNLLILRAFTKHYAMAGLRLGYCLCGNPPLLERMAQCGQPWGVSIPAQVAGVAALRDTEYLQQSRELIAAERAYLKESLAKLGLRVIGSQANYLFFRCEQPLAAALEGYGILIRSCANYRGLDESYYRIAVKSHADNEKLVAALTAVLGGEPSLSVSEENTDAPAAEPSDQQSPAEKPAEPKTEKPEPTAEEPAIEPLQTQTVTVTLEDAPKDEPEDELPLKIPNQDLDTPPSAEQKKQYRSLREKSKKYDWEGEDK